MMDAKKSPRLAGVVDPTQYQHWRFILLRARGTNGFGSPLPASIGADGSSRNASARSGLSPIICSLAGGAEQVLPMASPSVTALSTLTTAIRMLFAVSFPLLDATSSALVRFS